MSKRRPGRQSGQRRSYLKMFSSEMVNTGPTPNKQALGEYAARTHSYDQDMPLTKICGADLDYWAPIKPHVVYNQKTGTYDEVDNCPPRIRVLLKIKNKDKDAGVYAGGFYFINLYNGKYRKLDMFHGRKYFFIEEKFGCFYRSRDYDKQVYAMTAFRTGTIEGWTLVFTT